jgi:DNA-binding response OmpR family regulator
MGLQLAMEQDFDLIILDVILPQVNGFEICSEIKRFKPEIPVLMLTALSTIQDKLKGFDRGADDYLTKPFHFEELLARINAKPEKPNSLPVLTYTADDLVMDCYKKVVKGQGRRLH